MDECPTKETMKISNKEFEILGYVSLKGSITAPLLNIRTMDDQRERELAEQSADAWGRRGTHDR